MKSVAEELDELRQLPDPWSLIYSDRERFSVRAVACFRCITGTASEYKRELESVDDEDLDLLVSNAASSAVKTKALAVRLNRRSKRLRQLATA